MTVGYFHDFGKKKKKKKVSEQKNNYTKRKEKENKRPSRNFEPAVEIFLSLSSQSPVSLVIRCCFLIIIIIIIIGKSD